MKKYLKVFIFLLVLVLIPVKVNAKTATDFNLETPRNYATYNKSMLVGGWLMTESNNPTFHVYIDNEEVETTINRVSRRDVNNVFPNYSNNSNNQKPGFNTTIDLSNYKSGKHILTINILDYEKNEVLKESSTIFYIERYKADFNLETPSTNTKIAKSMKIGGWLMTESDNPVFHIYIDNEEVETTINRVSRKDVNNVFPNYSNNSNNQKPGFNTAIDTSIYPDGKHTLTIKILDSEQNEIIKECTREITIEKYKTKFNLETPNNNTKVAKSMKIGGWLMTENDNPVFHVYINDEEVNTTINRISRKDVNNVFPNYSSNSNNQKPGFNASIDLSSYKDGNYKLEVRVVDANTNEILTREYRNIILKKYEGIINVETPLGTEELGTTLIVGGWFLSEYKDSEIEVYIDNQFLESEITRIKRPDVLKVIPGYGGETTNPKPGYNTRIDISDIEDGIHNLTVKIVNKEKEDVITSSTKRININKNKSIINLEGPKNSQKRNIKIGGWYLSVNTNSYLKLFIDNVEVESEITRIKRPDVLNVVKGYGDESINPTPGFSMNYDLKNYKDGKHTITVKIFESKNNQVIGEATNEITLKKYDGTLNIETPKTNGEVNRNMKIGGWSLSTDTDDDIRVLIDNEVKETTITKKQRPDVLSAVTGYGDENTNPTPGYSTVLDLTDYKDGKHTVTVQIIDTNTNDVIAERSTEFKLKKYNGEINIDIPQTSMVNSNTLVISGWEMSELDNSYVEIYIDNNKIDAPISRFERPDVIETVTSYGTIAENATPGYNTTIDISSLSNGSHKLTVKLFSKLNEYISEKSKGLVKYDDVYFGIDVSNHNGTIDWKTVKQDGVNFAFIRVGFRGYGTGAVVEDDKFKENITNALANNISCGVYFYSQAINENEAISEADFTVGKLQSYGVLERLKLPIVIDTEFTDVGIGRADSLTREQRTKVVKAFAERIKQHGYTPMIYASRDFLYFSLNMNELSSYDVWLAHYTSTDDPMNHQSNYNGPYKVWQYTSKGRVNGISGNVDKNISYVKY